MSKIVHHTESGVQAAVILRTKAKKRNQKTLNIIKNILVKSRNKL